MATILLTALVFLLAMGGLAIGVLLGRAPIKGSCGGIACIKGVKCGACQAGRRRP